ncbi:MAG: 30S ribosomal protein S1 [Spirochaetia bacterium]|nr:30S ribosomal protein S1 [Spirochaetia bacterium]
MTVEPKSSTPFDLDQNELESMEQMLNEMDDNENPGKGTIIEATVMDVYDNEVFMDLGTKQNGRCSLQEFDTPPEKNERFNVVVILRHEDGMVEVSRKEAAKRISWNHVKSAFEENAQITGKVLKEVRHGYLIDAGGVELFMPLSQTGQKKNAKLKIGQEISFKILELKDKYFSGIVSHLAVISERNDQCWKELQEKYSENDIIEGTVSKKVSFGVFINVAGVEGLLHQSDISWKKFAPFKDKFKIGETVQVKILSMDSDHNRLSLGLKQLTENPWEWAKNELQVGSSVHGTVTSITDYGVFVELREGLEGLIHVSELTWAKRVKHPKKYLSLGQEVDAQVLSIDFEKQRVGLGIKQLTRDPWSVIADEVAPGDELEGEITSVTKFGSFVKIREDIEGLIHFKDYTWDEKVDHKMLKKGDVVKYKILDVNTDERRISCGVKQMSPNPYQVLQSKYRKGDVIDCKVTGITSFGIFVDIGEGFEGLVHISRIPMKEGETLESLFKKDDKIQAALLKIDPEEKRIALSIKDVEKRKEKEIYHSYMKSDSPSTSTLGAFFKKDGEG